MLNKKKRNQRYEREVKIIEDQYKKSYTQLTNTARTWELKNAQEKIIKETVVDE